MSRDIAREILDGLDEAAAYLDGRAGNTRTTFVNVPERVDVKAIRDGLGLSQAEFASRYGIPVHTLRKWETGAREPDAAVRAYLTIIQRNPAAVADALKAA